MGGISGTDQVADNDSNGFTEGFYRDFWYGRNGQYDTYDATKPNIKDNIDFQEMHAPLTYANGLVSNSKCYQCCNTSDNCNQSWTLTTEAHWNTNHDLSPTS